jgi:hypothetical protein
MRAANELRHALIVILGFEFNRRNLFESYSCSRASGVSDAGCATGFRYISAREKHWHANRDNLEE